MTTLDLVITESDHETAESVADQARLAESHGFGRVSMGETTGWNTVPVLTLVADRTEEIGISNDVFSPYSRSPALLAQTALTLHDLSDGRYRLGLGASSPALASQWHGQAFDRPLRRLRETIEIAHEVYSGERVTYDGDLYDLGGLRYDRPVPDDPPAIDVAALGPTSVELTGRFADGWVPQLFTVDGLANRLEDLRRGADLGDRDPAAVRVAPMIRCFAHEDRERAREQTRKMVAFLVGAYGPFYGDSVAEQGYPDVVEEVRAIWSDSRDTDAMAEAVTDELLDDVAAAGAPEEVRERVSAYLDLEDVDTVRAAFVAGASQADKESTMEALAELND